MKKLTITIAICSVLTLVACGKTSDSESSNPTTATDTMSEQNTPALSEQQTSPSDRTTETTTGTTTQTEQAAFEAGSETNEKVDQAGNINKE
jgi:major membrane immunogen (membrane-anchored lipoprotein)